MNAEDGIYNLTALADGLRRNGAAHVLPVLDHGVLSATLLRPEPGEPFEDGPAAADTIYVITAGYCRLCSGGVEDVEATAGDVMFLPAGQAPHFTKLSRKFELWRLILRVPAT